MGHMWSSSSRRAKEEEDPFEEACKVIAKANRIAVFTGAGISVDSGIPDFRSPGGLWERFNPFLYCDYDTFLSRPELFWTMVMSLYKDIHLRLGGTLGELRSGNVMQPKPNEGHKALAELGELAKVTVITQNIDGLHQRAGSKRVIELHGTEADCICMKCGATVSREEVLQQMIEAKAFEEGAKYVPKHEKGGCGGVLKANVVFFGDALPTGAMMRAAKSVYASSVVIVVGSSLEVAPANTIPSIVKYRPFGKLIILNLDTSGKTQADIFLQGSASLLLPKVISRVKELSRRK